MECNSTEYLWNCSADNSSVAATKEGKPVVVEQGPKWLVELGYAGPEWLPILLQLVLLVLLVALIGKLMFGEITTEQVMEVARNGLLVSCVVVLSTVSVSTMSLSYLQDVAVGGVGGFVVSAAVFRVVEDRIRGVVEAELRTNSRY